MKLTIMTRMLLVAAFAACIVGCGDGTVRVSGNVTFNGKPIEEGQVRFMPKKDTQTRLTVAPIKNGKFDTAATNNVPAGEYQIQFFGYDTRFPEPAGPGAADRPQYLPPACNTMSEHEITLKSGQSSVVQDFQLTGIPVPPPMGAMGGGVPPQ